MKRTVSNLQIFFQSKVSLSQNSPDLPMMLRSRRVRVCREQTVRITLGNMQAILPFLQRQCRTTGLDLYAGSHSSFEHVFSSYECFIELRCVTKNTFFQLRHIKVQQHYILHMHNFIQSSMRRIQFFPPKIIRLRIHE